MLIRSACLAALDEEHGADVGESPQHHPLGEEAEVDFESVSFYLNRLLDESARTKGRKAG